MQEEERSVRCAAIDAANMSDLRGGIPISNLERRSGRAGARIAKFKYLAKINRY